MMKKLLLGLTALTLMTGQFAIAGSSIEKGGQGERKAHIEAPSPEVSNAEAAASRAEAAGTPVASGVDGMSPAQGPDGNMRTTGPATGEDHRRGRSNDFWQAKKKVKKKNRKAFWEASATDRTKARKPFWTAQTHNDSNIFGILALIFGIVGFISAWAFFPVGILFAIAAIVLGAIGLSKNRPGRGMAIVGLILGILTILLPVLLFTLILASFTI